MQKNVNIEKIIFKVVQMKFLAMHITNQKWLFFALSSCISSPKNESMLTLKSSKMQMSLFLRRIWRNVASHHQCLSNGCSAVNVSPPDVNWWTVDYCDVFIRLSFWRHPFTAEHPLLRHWCDATFLQIRRRNKLNYILDDPRVNTCSVNLHFWGKLFL